MALARGPDTLHESRIKTKSDTEMKAYDDYYCVKKRKNGVEHLLCCCRNVTQIKWLPRSIGGYAVKIKKLPEHKC